MGTTCTAIAIRDDRLWLAHVGDTRAYLLRDGVLAQISDDQTLHAQLVRDGVMTAAEAANSPGGNIILQALGPRRAISPTIWTEGRRCAVATSSCCARTGSTISSMTTRWRGSLADAIRSRPAAN